MAGFTAVGSPDYGQARSIRRWLSIDARTEGGAGATQGLLVEGRHHLAAGLEALGHLQPEPALGEGLGKLQEQIVDVVPALAADLEDVPEPLGGQQSGERPLALDQGVGDQRRAVDEAADLLRPRPAGQQLADAVQHPRGRVWIGGQHLGHGDAARLLAAQHEIGEGPADVDGEDGPVRLLRRPVHAASRGPPLRSDLQVVLP